MDRFGYGAFRTGYVLAHGGGGRVTTGGTNVRDAEQYLACSVGSLLLPFEVCKDRVSGAGFLGAALKRTEQEN
jgi:hypothetical protein